MRLFVSAVITGFELYRQAAIDAVEALGYEAVKAEDFGARPDTPQRACLEAARTADVTVLLLGERYGYVQQSGLSATHEEFREARDHRSVLPFVQSGVDPEERQQEFITEVQQWAGGTLTAHFGDPDELHRKVTRALHDHALRQATGPADAGEMHGRALSVLPQGQQGMHSGQEPQLHLAVAGGPRHLVVRPAALDPDDLGRRIHQQAMFGPHEVFDRGQGAAPRLQGTRLVVSQSDRGVELHEDGTVLVSVPALRPRGPDQYLRPLVEEDIRERLDSCIGFAAWLLDQVDSLHRLSDVVVVAALSDAGYTEWRTRAQGAGGSMTISAMTRDNPVVVPSAPRRYPRGSLTADADAIAADLLALFRRAFT